MEYYQYYLMGIILLPALIFAIIAQIKVKSAYAQYSKVISKNGVSAKVVAERVLEKKGINDVVVKRVGGELTDYYSDKEKTVALSQDIYDSASVSAIGIALHEVGHAIQYAEGYGMIKARNVMIKVSNISSVLLWPLVIIGLIFNLAVLDGGLIGNIFLWAGIGFFGFTVILNLVTLPVEYDASNRAKKVMEEEQLLTKEERQGATKVLNAAALTYVAALIVSVMYLARFLLVVFINSDRRRR
ncbi:MAG TPA: hypothetical protein DCO89_00330 [Clostridiales bacterium]|nr:hypothetical protein [Clostridiales bacterium]